MALTKAGTQEATKTGGAGFVTLFNAAADAVDANTAKTDLITKATASAGAKIVLAEGTNNGAHTLTVQAPAALAASRTVTTPDVGGYLAVSTAALTLGEVDVLDDAAAGTVVASKAVVASSNKDVSAFRNLDAVNIDAGASGAAGTVDIFPETASRGKLTIDAANSTGDHSITLRKGDVAGNRTITIPDPGKSASLVHTGDAAQTIEGAVTISGVATVTDMQFKSTATTIDLKTQTDGNVRFLSAAASPATTPTVQLGTSSYPVRMKIHARPHAESALEIRNRNVAASGLTAMGLDSICELRPETTATDGYARGAMGICHIASGKTLAGSATYVTGLYGQWRADGTVNGAGVAASAIYGIIGDGGTYTACSHLSALWLDSHLAQPVASGKTSFVCITNNGGIQYDNGIYIYGGTASQGVRNLLNLDTCTDSGMVGANQATSGAKAVSSEDYRLIRIVIDGTDHYLMASTAWSHA